MFEKIEKIIRIFKPAQNKWIVKALLIAGIGLLIPNPWFLSIIEALLELLIGKKIGLDKVDFPFFWSGWILVALSVGLHLLNRRDEREDKKRAPSQHLIVIVHKSINDFVIPDIDKLHNNKYAEYTKHIIEINQVDCYVNGELKYIELAVEKQLGVEKRVLDYANGKDFEVVYIGLAHIPLLFHLGYFLSDKYPITFFEYDRVNSNWNILKKAGNDTLEFETEKELNTLKSKYAIIMVSISYLINKSDVLEVIPEYSVGYHIKAKEPKLDSIKNMNSINELKKSFRAVLDEIIQKYPDVEKVGVFYSGPVALGVELSRKISQRTDPQILVYNFEYKSNPKYKWAINLSQPINSDLFIIKK